MAARRTHAANAKPRPRRGGAHHPVGNAPLLTREQEIELAKRIERGDFDAKTRMIEANLRLVAVIANDSASFGLPTADLFQEGVIGLIRAAEKFDYRKGYKFSTYASLWIRQAIQRGLQKNSRTVYLPADVWREASRIRRCRAALTQRLGREPSSSAIAAELGVPDAQVKSVIQAFCDAVSLNATTPDAEGTELGEMLLDANSPSPDREGQVAALKAAVWRSVGALDGRAREVIELRYGVGDCDRACTVTRVVEKLKIPRGEVLRIEGEAMAVLAKDSGLAAWSTQDVKPAPTPIGFAA